jgi:polysaccharide export outer membrane protein
MLTIVCPPPLFLRRGTRIVACVGILVLSTLPESLAAQDPPVRPQGRVVSPVTDSTLAQQASAALGRPVTNADILNAIKSSGLSASEIRSRLQQAGFDPSLADPLLGSATASLSPPSASILQAMSSIGLPLSSTMLSADDSDAADVSHGEPLPNSLSDTLLKATHLGPRVFGREIFSSRSTAFDPEIAGPVDPAYRIGIGDALQVVLTGQVEQVFQTVVRRDGTVLLPTVGLTPIAGLTLEAAGTALRERSARVFSGLSEGKTHLDLSVSKVRTNQVFVIGDVEKPGSYTVNGLSTAFHAIARAGGPTTTGSFRNIQVRRGGQVVKDIDLYNYLIRGDATADLRTEQGDVIFVPPATRSITVRGAVRKEGIFELRDTESFKDLLFFAGGFLPTAATSRVQIERILPVQLRRPGVDRVVLDIPVTGRPVALDTLSLLDNDILTVFEISGLRRNMVQMNGAVFQPGTYEWSPGLTVGQLVKKADGILPWAVADRVKVTRRIVNTGRKEITSVNLADGSGDGFELREYDEVLVLDSREGEQLDRVAITGAVRSPGVRQWAQNITLGDLVDLANGFRPEAQLIDVARRVRGQVYTDSSAIVGRFAIRDSVGNSGWRAFQLERDDRVVVRASPGFKTPGTVSAIGAFAYPGSYVIIGDGERLSHVIQRAGGVLPTAYSGSLNVTRNGRPVPLDFKKVVAGSSTDDIIVADGDEIQIQAFSNVVNVGGAVERPASVPYRDGWGLRDYIDAAGGFAQHANESSIIVVYASGAVAREKDHFWGHSAPKVEPGATITVGARDPNDQTDWGAILKTTAQIVVSAASLIISYVAVTK